MRKKWLLTSILALGCTLTAGGLSVVSADTTGTQTSVATPKTYGLYVSETLAGLRGGKTMTAVPEKDGLMYCVQGDGDGETTDATRKVAKGNDTTTPYYSVQSDTAYAYNAANIVTAPAGTNNYQSFGVSELYLSGHSGGNQRGGEWALTEAIDTQEYGAISVDAVYKATTPTGDTEGYAYIYLYGLDKDNNAVVINKKVPFGVNYWNTTVIEFREEMVSVSRIGLSVIWRSVDNQGSVSNGNVLYFADVTVHARNEAETIDLTANGMDLDFYNGNTIASKLDGNAYRVYHSNTGYAAMGNFNATDDVNEYIYGTQRMSVGSYGVLKLKDPVKASEYKYIDIEMLAYPQVADNTYEAETATEFTYSFLKYDATTAEGATAYTLTKGAWKICRLNTADFADESGFVNKIIIQYTGNNSGREASEEAKYTIQMGIHNAQINNDETAYETVSLISQRTAIKKAGVTLGDDIKLRYTVAAGNDLTNLTATIVYDGEEYKTTEYEEVDDGLLFVFDGISPKNLGDTVDITLTANSVKQKNAGTFTVAKKLGYSVKAYCESILQSNAQTLNMSEEKFAKLQTLVVDLLNYGAAAQVYANYNTDALCNADIGAYQDKATAFDQNVAGVYENTKSADGKIAVTAARLWLDSQVNIGFKLAIDSSVTGATAQVKIGDGEWTDAEIVGSEVKVTGLAATQFDQSVSVRVLINGAESGAVCEYSVFKYIANTHAKTDGEALTANAKLARALYSYGVSAVAYKNA